MCIGAVVAANGADCVATHDYRRMTKRWSVVKIVEDVLGRRDVVELIAAWFAEFVDARAACTQHADAGMGVEKPDLTSKAFGQGNVVTVHAGDERGLCQADHVVEADDQTRVCLVDRFDSRIEMGESIDDRARFIGRSIVNDQKLEVGEGLRQNAFNGVRQIGCIVINAHGDADAGKDHSLSAQFSARSGRGTRL